MNDPDCLTLRCLAASGWVTWLDVFMLFVCGVAIGGVLGYHFHRIEFSPVLADWLRLRKGDGNG